MVKTVWYLVGAMSLHLTQFSDPNPFFSIFLPLVDAVFLIYLLWQLIFFMSLHDFSDGNSYQMQDLLIDIWDFRYDIRESGLLYALIHLCLNITEVICFLFAVFYYYKLSIQLITS